MTGLCLTPSYDVETNGCDDSVLSLGRTQYWKRGYYCGGN